MIRASDIALHAFCPRALYLERTRGVKPARTPEHDLGLVGHTVRRELAMREAKILSRAGEDAGVAEGIRKELALIKKEAPELYKQELAGADFEAGFKALEDEFQSELALLEKKLAAMIEEFGLEGAVEYATPWRTNCSLSSSKLCLTGRVDKIVEADGARYPLAVKTGEVPREGAWERDRVQVAAYVLLLEEESAEGVECGFAEYARAWERRPVMVGEQLRRSVLDARDAAQKILDGSVPEICAHGSGAKCEACGLAQECYKI